MRAFKMAIEVENSHLKALALCPSIAHKKENALNI